ncbi:MAG: hydrogenase nickel incorporation protein HypB [Methylophilaceae bacterium]|nr:hydrogenase nickel incorporation protein HypB [Methylophilaceae bacterium]
MCTTCGCATGEVKIEGQDEHHHAHWHVHEDGAAHSHAQDGVASTKYRHVQDAHEHIHGDHAHPHTHDHLHFGLGAAHSHASGMSQSRMVQIERDILSKNNDYAAQNRTFFAGRGILALNLVSSPGSGKTSLLVRSITELKQSIALAVIEGDQQTTNDAERIRATGAPAIQINTGKGCHLDAHMVRQALPGLELLNESLLFIENVGNLVCPAAFDLGEACKVAILSTTEGEDKPLKYPDMFQAARLMLLNKCDLLPYLDFDVKLALENARRVNPAIEVICVSAKTGEGMADWLAWIARERTALLEKRQGNALIHYG